ncbi:nucleoside triphosphate pyrophosphohydrolase [Actinoplanes sp. NBRC 101535]|uniref:nucleoside triphosphate pyrophosphohydrolase n=1 Tax=Actinoplanes sp. NBRC 101535 TaxID=3032196 RepID=UPI0024A31213|nr:nucleoside triphosphate pyrophosphohydrolase [Actinoplanes sp. NBRC 101535]GLY02153.1 hypothetical protein Acsp01_25320 [Actinoplanes sp. NBRC 101535]
MSVADEGHHYPGTGKLVRDNIPDIVRTHGAEPIIEVADQDQYRHLLRQKLLEEAQEFLASEDVEELADVLEVVRALSMDLGTDLDSLEKIRQDKMSERGAFEKRLIWYGNRPGLA